MIVVIMEAGAGEVLFDQFAKNVGNLLLFRSRYWTVELVRIHLGGSPPVGEATGPDQFIIRLGYLLIQTVCRIVFFFGRIEHA